MESHRRQVHNAILDAAAELIVEQGPLSLAMSAIAERACIGRATLYKYFPDVASILVAWHRRDFADQLGRIERLSVRDDVTLDDLAHFVRAHRRHHPHRKGAEIVGPLAHSVVGDTIEGEIVTMLAGLLQALARRKEVRTDYSPTVLARWVLHAVHAPPDIDDQAVAELLVASLAAPKRTL